VIQFRRKWRAITYGICVIVIATCLSIDFYNPAKLVSTSVLLPGGIEALSTPDLLIQYISEEGTTWGSRGYCVYKSTDGLEFEKAFKLPSGDLISWLGNSRSIRALTGHNEICEIYPLKSGTILAFSGGYIWRSVSGGNTFQKVHKLRHFGPGIGRGVMPQGMTEDDHGAFYYGEYFRNEQRGPVFVYRSLDDGRSWEGIYRFTSGEIRHIHSLQMDPYSKSLWITTGDNDQECMIGYFIEKGEGVTLYKVGSGSQKWRAVSLLFTEDEVFWGTDSPENQNYIYRLEKKNINSKQCCQQVCAVDGPIYYSTRLCDGTLIMARTVEGSGEGEWDKLVSLWLSKDGEQWIRTPLGERLLDDRYAFMRFGRGACSPNLYATISNTRHSDKALLRIPSGVLFR
jgi:hypothetical protein